MDTAWIQVFVLMLSECVAPEGKTVCQQQELQIQFLDRGECELALEQLVSLKERADNVIVEADSARCVPSARRRDVFSDLADIRAAQSGSDDWQAPPADETEDDDTREAHLERLARLQSCEETGGREPCKVGDIIIEAPAGKKIEVWRRNQ